VDEIQCRENPFEEKEPDVISVNMIMKSPCVFARDGLSSAQPTLVFLTKGWLSPSQQFQLSRYEALGTLNRSNAAKF